MRVGVDDVAGNICQALPAVGAGNICQALPAAAAGASSVAAASAASAPAFWSWNLGCFLRARPGAL